MISLILTNQYQIIDSNFVFVILLFTLIIGVALVYESDYSNLFSS